MKAHFSVSTSNVSGLAEQEGAFSPVTEAAASPCAALVLNTSQNGCLWSTESNNKGSAPETKMICKADGNNKKKRERNDYETQTIQTKSIMQMALSL